MKAFLIIAGVVCIVVGLIFLRIKSKKLPPEADMIWRAGESARKHILNIILMKF